MKVKKGEIEKVIPSKYLEGAKHMKAEEYTAPRRKRLSKLERFRMAERTWRLNLNLLEQEYLENEMVVGVVKQVNRFYESRYVAEYSNGTHARIPNSIGKLYPNVVEESFHWL